MSAVSLNTIKGPPEKANKLNIFQRICSDVTWVSIAVFGNFKNLFGCEELEINPEKKKLTKHPVLKLETTLVTQIFEWKKV